MSQFKANAFKLRAALYETDRIIQIWLNASRLAHDFIPFEYWISHVSDMRNIYPSAIVRSYIDFCIENFAPIFETWNGMQFSNIDFRQDTHISMTNDPLEE